MDRDLTLPPVHLSIVQPAGYVHSLAFLDPARYLRHQLRRFGVEVTMAKNRLRKDAVNLVFGTHLGFDPNLRERHPCLFVNLEQLGPGGAKVSEEYLKLLRTSGVVDYDLANVGAYGADPSDVPLIPFRHAPYLEKAAAEAAPLEQRPIDLLFFGSMNERRKRMIERIEACGVTVAMFDQPLYAEERDHYIRQAKAVLNCHFYESATFEQVRAFHCLSLGTPLISERSPLTRPDAPFDQAVTWFDDCSLETFFGQTFGTPAYYQHARQQLQGWKQHDPVDAYADLMAFAAGYLQGHAKGKPQQAWRPTQVNLGSGKDYKAGWLNLDVIDRTEPDLVLDLGKPQDFPVKAVTRFGTEMVLEAGSVDKVCANNVLQKSSDLGRLMSNTLKLLTKGGTFEIEVPYEQAATAWQDPTHLRAMNENSWIYYTQWFWYLGWFEHRFEMVSSEWLDLKLVPCAREQAAFMKVTLQKIETSAYERTIARTMQSGLDDFDAGLNDSAVTDVAAEEEAANLAHSPETRWGAVSRNLLNA
jgi:SAM-dependent methyltransferase